jgi:hypothetical protein
MFVRFLGLAKPSRLLNIVGPVFYAYLPIPLITITNKLLLR